MRKGAFDLDPEYLKRAQADLDRLNPKQEETKKEDGRSMLEVLREKRPDCRVVVLTGYGAIATAVLTHPMPAGAGRSLCSWSCACPSWRST